MTSGNPLAESPTRQWIPASVFFLFFWLAFFAQFPLQNALPGNTDSVLLIALSNSWLNKVLGYLGFGPGGQAMFPVPSVITYGEAATGIALWFSSLKLLGFSDLIAYYLYVSLTFALTSAATFIFAGRFLTSFPARMFAAFAFPCSNMFFAHIDDAFHVFYFFPLLAFITLDQGLREKNKRLVVTAAALGGLQVYFSIYIFIYQSVMLAALVAYHWLWRKQRLDWPLLVKCAGLYTLVAFPLWAYYTWARLKLNIVPVYEPSHITRVMSWQPRDLFLALPDNFLYGWITEMPQNWPQLRHHNLIGFLVILSGLFALTRRGEHRLLLGGIGLVGLILSLGPWFMSGYETLYPTPLYPLYKWFPIFAYHRIPVRAYFLVLLALTTLSAYTLQLLLQRFPGRTKAGLIVAFFVVVHVLENVPFPMRAYKVGPFLETPGEYAAFLEKQEKSLVLDLPSRYGFRYLNWSNTRFRSPGNYVFKDPSQPVLEVSDNDSVSLSSQDIFLYSRDAYYMNWQTKHKHDIVGGVAGYFPASRLVYEGWILQLPDEDALRWLREQGVRFIAYHPELILPGDAEILPGLRQSPLLRLVLESERTLVFEFVGNEG